jgi:hypothetical protein
MENHVFNGKIHYKWPFSIAMLVYQRVTIVSWWSIEYLAMEDPSIFSPSNATPLRSKPPCFMGMFQPVEKPRWMTPEGIPSM